MVSVKGKVSPKKNNKIQKSDKIEKLKKRNPKTNKVVPPVESPKPLKQVNPALKTEVAQSKKVKYVMPTKAITDELVNSCLNALLNVVVPHDKQKNAIFDDEKPIFAEIHCMKIQNTRGNLRL